MNPDIDSATKSPATASASPRKPGGKPAVLETANLCVRHEGCTEAALENVQLEIHPSETILLIGPSGGGKTTLLRAMEGSLPATSGSLVRHGRTALIYQDLRLVAERTVLQNVCAGAAGQLRFGRQSCIEVRALELLTDLGLEEYAHQRVSTLSGGQKQRVAIARALCARPVILLADEPLAALDRENARRVLALFQRLQKKYGFALVLSVHNIAIDPEMFDRALLVRTGKVHELGRDEFEYIREELSRPLSLTDEEEAEMATRQDVLLAEEPTFTSGMAFKALALLALMVAIVWAERSLNLLGGLSGGALSGALGFLQAAVPGSVAEVTELPWGRLFASLIETIQMAIIGTSGGILLSLPLAALAARQTGPKRLRLAVRFLLNVVRTIPSIIWALIFVASVGLGPLAGVLALIVYSTSYLTKFFYEGLENIDDRPAMALRSLGATKYQSFMEATLPAARSSIIGSCLFVFEYNIRSASILGVVGAGGIGQDLMYYIEWRQFPAAFAGLALVLVVVVALDGLSGWWREKVVKQRGT